MFESHATSTDSRQIRVFLSSTFVDFMEERELLVKRVFPALNRRARDRGVELIDVDLRWGVTEEQTKEGLTLPLCLGEIDRCRPYFIGLLGERHGWVPPADFYKPELLERHPWLRQHKGGASVTELEILHGVLRNPEMAGHAFFFLRDPAYALAKKDPTWLAEGEEERQRLHALKEQVRASRFPVVEGLPDPEAIASRIEDDLWELIEERFPEQEEPDALEQENRKHASYRHSRTGKGQYIGGEGYIEQLEGWIQDDEQQILITGESGSGKSALLANWMAAHAQAHPEDVVYAHHLGCTNDANALQPMLARLIQNASRLLLNEEVITEELVIPEEWWELVARVAETMQNLGRWCQQQGKRWIWVLDGLDRLDPDEQNALPWLPQSLPAGIHVVASALTCPARSILSERDYTTLTIEPLAAAEQEQLIHRYLERYTKELDGGLRQQILAHPLAGSPLLLKVLLEELRQCGRHDTLKQQLTFYLSSQTVDDLYERVLERLENDGSGDAVRKVMTAIWASRAGLSESEVLAITGLAPLQWAPIDLALEKAFGRNGNRLVFDHDFLRIAVEDRYLPSEEQHRQAHSELADWYQEREGWDARDSEELPWQLQEAGRLEYLRDLIITPWILANLQWDRGSREVIDYWRATRNEGDGELDEAIVNILDEEIEERRGNLESLIWLLDRIAELFQAAGLYREPLLKLRQLSLELEEASDERGEETMLSSLLSLADAHHALGQYDAAMPLYQRSLEAHERLLGTEHHSTLITVNKLAALFLNKGDYEQAEAFLKRALEASERLLGPEHPDTLDSVANLGNLFINKGDIDKAEACLVRALEAKEQLLGTMHDSILHIIASLGLLYIKKGEYEQAEMYAKRAFEGFKRLLGSEHPITADGVQALGYLYDERGDFEQAKACYLQALETRERILGSDHPDTYDAIQKLILLHCRKDKTDEVLRFIDLFVENASEFESRNLERFHILGLAGSLCEIYGDDVNAEACLRRELEVRERLQGAEHPDTLDAFERLAHFFRDKCDYERAETYYRRVMDGKLRHSGLNTNDTDFLWVQYNLAKVLHKLGLNSQAVALLQQLQASMNCKAIPNNPNCPGFATSDEEAGWPISDAEELMRAIEEAM